MADILEMTEFARVECQPSRARYCSATGQKKDDRRQGAAVRPEEIFILLLRAVDLTEEENFLELNNHGRLEGRPVSGMGRRAQRPDGSSQTGSKPGNSLSKSRGRARHDA
jgi:hypothetical protein